MAGMVPKLQQDGTWVYITIGVALAIVDLEEIRVYITCCHNMVAQYITNFHIMDLCLKAYRNPVLCLSRRWWEHPNLNILGIRSGQEESERERIRGRKNRREGERDSRVGND